MANIPWPWHVHEASHTDLVSVRLEDGSVVCQMWEPNAEEHARLIAAAPETLAALKAMITAWSYMPGEIQLNNVPIDCATRMKDAYPQAQAAVAAAEPEEGS